MATEREDRDSIIEVLVRYATGIDEKDWVLFRTVFTDDVHADYGAIGTWTGLDQFTAWMEAAHEDMPHTCHRLTNFVVRVDGDRATSKSYVHAVVVTADTTQWFDAIGTYEDELRRTAVGWRIADRRFVSIAQRLVCQDG